jgi:16S rRNA (guanine527-N7)-methyltransferase
LVSGPLMRALHRGQELGFLGPETLSVQVAHSLELVSCAVQALGSPEGSKSPSPACEGRGPAFLDLGSGGGLPGLVVAERWPESSGTLLDSNGRKTTFLEEAVVACGWADRIVVVRSRAEVAGREREMRGRFDLVVARSFAAPPVSAECAAPFLRMGGLLVVSEPPPESGDPVSALDGPLAAPSLGPSDPARWPAGPLGDLGLVPLGVWRRTFGFEILRQKSPCPDRYPRREGIPAKRPLY